MRLEDAYKLKGYALTQIELWQNRVREANAVINEDFAKKQEALAPKTELQQKVEETGATNENHA